MAVIKVDPSGIELKAATVGNSSTLQVGDEVLAIGNPLGLTLAGSVTHGIVSALNRKLTIDGTTYNLIQTDAAINSGNSGGALINEKGELIGINFASYDAGQNLNLAIEISNFKKAYENNKNEESIKFDAVSLSSTKYFSKVVILSLPNKGEFSLHHRYQKKSPDRESVSTGAKNASLTVLFM